MSNPPLKRPYKALVSGWIAGARVEAGDRMDLTPAQAKYEPVEMAGDATEKTAPGRRRGAASDSEVSTS